MEPVELEREVEEVEEVPVLRLLVLMVLFLLLVQVEQQVEVMAVPEPLQTLLLEQRAHSPAAAAAAVPNLQMVAQVAQAR